MPDHAGAARGPGRGVGRAHVRADGDHGVAREGADLADDAGGDIDGGVPEPEGEADGAAAESRGGGRGADRAPQDPRPGAGAPRLGGSDGQGPVVPRRSRADGASAAGRELRAEGDGGHERERGLPLPCEHAEREDRPADSCAEHALLQLRHHEVVRGDI